MLKLTLVESRKKYPEFCCGEPDIDTYFNTLLCDDVNDFVNAAYILWQDNDIVGFFTLSQHAVRRHGQVHKGNFRDIPTTLLGQFAISRNFRGKSFNNVKYSILLMDCALMIHARISHRIGSTALMLNPINETVKSKFYEKFGLFSDFESKSTKNYMYATTPTILSYLDAKKLPKNGLI